VVRIHKELIAKEKIKEKENEHIIFGMMACRFARVSKDTGLHPVLDGLSAKKD